MHDVPFAHELRIFQILRDASFDLIASVSHDYLVLLLRCQNVGVCLVLPQTFTPLIQIYIEIN